MADDVGWNDLGFKNGLTLSPNIDKLVNEGVLFTNHHAFKVCAPSRGAFQTGRLPWQMGYYDNSPMAVQDFLNVDVDKFAISSQFKLLPEILAYKGYVSHAVGKWHLGHVMRKYTPTYRGYESFLGYYQAMTEDYWAHTHSVADDCPGPGLNGLWSSMSNNTGEILRVSNNNGTYESTLFEERAIKIIHEHKMTSDKPLFLFIAFHNEHDPHQAEREDIEKYSQYIKTDTYKVTASMISTMDAAIGNIIEALKQENMFENSVIGFSSDNGGPLDHANNYPLRGGKHTMYEGGIRTEAFLSSPLLPEASRGTSYDGLMHICDWRAIYAQGVAKMTADEANDDGPFSDESKNHWGNIIGKTSQPAREVLIHSVHSPKYYPGNCSMSCWGGRNCPAVITKGEMKFAVGHVGDPRRLILDEKSSNYIAFGEGNGKCGLNGFSNRCDSGKWNGTRPVPTPNDEGGCLYGCLFNLTADPQESTNLVNITEYSDLVSELKQILVSAGSTAPPWTEAPELKDVSHENLNRQMCEAAKRGGGMMPIDF